ncbi:efflux RND transporter periplasmic adaptor subunit [Winogradskyella sp. SYSU M77433]|uniref:efflux RND transporter periplasmic adaptor subunit n=1 Tax=Winogradskyella sp. SYSU M77433 TaxID=3042722 RepID=UPI0024815A3D|nr:efflux RND transporter periplasmic adaptor subunit [Winogradskyella sp. SYSU M77433]MDH7911588.1 efflux RND transporter periplasmic adaptor subunit [Winogradskyella sp. SYSU M77433]
MKNNKIIIYVGLLLSGVLVGWLLFGGSSNEEANHNHDEASQTNQMWTCSMHPQIMQPEPGDCPICGMDLIPAEAGADGLTADQFKLTPNAMALANIQTTVVGNGSIENGIIKLSGKIAENEEANAVQVSYFSGRIERLNISFTGEEVRKGQLLATIYSPELYAAQQELITASSLKESQPALYKAVRNKLKLWKLSENQINQIEASGKVIENFPVYATVSGTVTEKLVEQGDYIKQGQPLLKIANLNTVWANFDVYENQIEQFKKGQEVKVITNAYPNKTFKGTVDFIDPVLNTKTRTVDLRVVLNNKEAIFKPGMFVSAEIESDKINSNEVITVPSSAVLWTGERSVVYIKSNPNEPVFELKEVTLGNKIGDNYEVLDGLSSGNEIVTNGTFTVDAAAQLQGKKSMMNQPVAKEMTVNEDYLKIIRLESPKAFQQQLKQVYDNYINLKDALVEDNSEQATSDAKKLISSFRKINMELLTGEAHKQWMTLEGHIQSSANSISKSSEIKTQRDYFKQLSTHLIKVVQLFGVNEKVYVEFCPMADNNNGAYWLSKEEQILNPYFGDAMLKCGEVKQTIE